MRLTFGLLVLLLFVACAVNAQTDSTGFNPKWDYQIYLKQPAVQIKEILNEKTCEPINGTLSDNKKSVIMKNYQKGARIYLKVIYQDGSEEEIIKSSCFIDPVI